MKGMANMKNFPLIFRVKLNKSNPCIIVSEGKQAIAGVRKDIFIWDVKSETLIR